MRSIRTLILASVFALPAAPVLAQMYPGQDVTVNPWAIGAAPQRYGVARIHLHMPVHRHVVHHAAVAATTPAAAPAKSADTTAPASPVIGTMADTASPPPAAPPKKPAKHETKTAAVPPPPAAKPAASNDIGTTGMDDAIPFSLDGVHSAPAKPGPHPQQPPATKTASVQPPPEQTAPQAAATQPGMTKRGEILFTKNAADPAPAQFDGLKLLAGDLSEALKTGSSRIQLEAYGGNHGDKGSDARRLSLKRALSIRQVLIDNGVPANSIDVRAMGGSDDSGPADRVDVYVRAG